MTTGIHTVADIACVKCSAQVLCIVCVCELFLLKGGGMAYVLHVTCMQAMLTTWL